MKYFIITAFYIIIDNSIQNDCYFEINSEHFLVLFHLDHPVCSQKRKQGKSVTT